MALSFKEVAEIMKIIDSSSCDELVLEAEGTRLVIRRGGDGAVSQPSSAVPASAAVPVDPTKHPSLAAPATADASTTNIADEGTYTEKAPMVGTFYRRMSPDDPPLVDVGHQVSAGDPLCVIEVMKLYTTITASRDGIVEAILADDAALVEFDQPLFVIRPA